jgi:hypothetical protein
MGSEFPYGLSVVESLEEKGTEMLVGPTEKAIGMGTILQLCILVVEHHGCTSNIMD